MLKKIAASLLLLSSQLATAQTVPLEVSYSFKSPYDNAGEFKITNTLKNKITIKKIEFDVNVNISGTPYGNLLQWGSTVDSKLNSNSLTFHYVFNEAGNGVELSPDESKSMTYVFNSALGVFSNLGMDPSNVKVTLNDGKTLTLPLTGHCEGQFCNNPAPNYQIMGYYSDWSQYARNYNASDIPVNKLNHILYAFIGYDKTGAVHLLDPWADGKQLPAISQIRKQFPYMNASLSFGGWTLSYMFSDLAEDSNAREQFARNAVKAMKQVNFNGIDIDWEFPVANGAPGEPNHSTPQDGENFVKLLTDLRAELDRQGALDKTHYSLTIAVSSGVDKIIALENAHPGAWKQVADLIDHLNLMSYDMHGSYDEAQPTPYNVSDFMSAMQLDPEKDPTASHEMLGKFNVNDAVEEYKKVGVPAAKIVIGVPLYGRMSNITDIGESYGLYRTITTGTPAGEYDDGQSGATGMFDYKCIVDHNRCYGTSANHLAGMVLVDFTTNSYGQYSKTPWGYNSTGGKSQFITYDDEKSMEYKAAWVKQNKLGGVMLWELSGDMPASSPKSLVNSAQKILGGE